MNTGCAIHYHDKSSGKTHVVGFGLITYRTSLHEDRLAVATQDRTIGVGVGNSEQNVWAIVGYDNRTQLQILDTDTCLRLEWPSASLINVNVGSQTPEAWKTSDRNNVDKENNDGGIECP